MRLLVLYQARTSARDQPGYFDGFERMVVEGRIESHTAIAYLGVAEAQGWAALWESAYRAALEMRVDAVFLQFFHTQMPDPSDGIRRIKNLPTRPVIFSSLGDPYGRWTKRVPHSFRVPSKLSDVSFLTGMGYIARQLAARGSRNLVLMPNGCCQVHFSTPPPVPLTRHEFDVSFVGSRMHSRNPLSHFYWVARKRVEFVNAFTKRYGRAFALYGKGWDGNPSWQGPLPYVAQHEAYRRSAVVVGGMPNAYHDYYTSDRVFIATASGIPLIDYWVRGVDRLLTPGRDWWLARDLDEMFALSDKLLEMPSNERLAMAGETRTRILTHHTQYHRCIQMMDIVESLRQARLQGRIAPKPELKFVQPSQDAKPAPDAIVEWRG